MHLSELNSSRHLESDQFIQSDSGASPHVMGRRGKTLSRIPLLGVLCWAFLVAGLLIALERYSREQGSISSPPTASAANIELSKSPYTLIMAIHPKCPCTKASLAELERLLSRSRNQLEVLILAFIPAGEEPAWAHTDLWERASKLPGTTLRLDTDSRIAMDLGCATSGSVVVYDTKGNAQFWGGITASRGHEGNNLGRASIQAIVEGNRPATRTTPVYGCSLRSTNDTASTPECCELGGTNEPRT